MYRVKIESTSERGNPKIISSVCGSLEEKDKILSKYKEDFPNDIPIVEEFEPDTTEASRGILNAEHAKDLREQINVP